mgnify:CR=1 FL=1
MKNTVLIIDDDKALCESLSLLLEDEGIQCNAIGGGKDALMVINPEVHKTIILDLIMPDMYGLDVCRELQKNPGLCSIPVLVLTSDTDKKTMLQALDAGASDFLTKPFDNEELIARVRSMLRIRQYLETIKHLEKEKETLTHMIVHEINNANTAISGSAQCLQMKKDAFDRQTAANLSRIITASENISCSTENILGIYKMESAQLTIHPKECNLCELVSEVVSGQIPFADSSEVQIRTELPDVTLTTDTYLAGRILSNIIHNAIKHSPPEECIHVTADTDSENCRIHIRDNGPGLTREQVEKIFIKFYRTETTDKKGMGLGLAYCRMAAENLGGKIIVRGNKGKGCEFTVCLPLVMEHKQTPPDPTPETVDEFTLVGA